MEVETWFDDCTSDEFHRKAQGCDVFTAGFPCQPFSAIGKNGGETDVRGNIIWHIVRYVRKHLPQVVVLENVKGLLTRLVCAWMVSDSLVARFARKCFVRHTCKVAPLPMTPFRQNQPCAGQAPRDLAQDRAGVARHQAAGRRFASLRCILAHLGLCQFWICTSKVASVRLHVFEQQLK